MMLLNFKYFFLFLTAIFFLLENQAFANIRACLLLEHDEPTAWNALLRKGFEAATAKAGMQADVIIIPPGSDQTALFRNAAENHELVIVASDGLHEILRDNAANFRRVMFGAIDAGIRAPNIMSVTFADEQAAFLAGAAAAIIAQEKKKSPPVIGWLSGADIPAIRTLYNGFAEGALLAVPGCRIIQAVTGSFTDKSQAALKAAWLLEHGATVIALAAGAGNDAAWQEIAKAGAEIIDLDSPIHNDALGTINKSADRAVEEIVASAASGKFGGKQIIVYDLGNHGIDFTGLPEYAKKHRLSERAVRRVKELRQELVKKSIRIPSLRRRTLCDCLD